MINVGLAQARLNYFAHRAVVMINVGSFRLTPITVITSHELTNVVWYVSLSDKFKRCGLH